MAFLDRSQIVQTNARAPARGKELFAGILLVALIGDRGSETGAGGRLAPAIVTRCLRLPL
jgi:hypothetical protein